MATHVIPYNEECRLDGKFQIVQWTFQKTNRFFASVSIVQKTGASVSVVKKKKTVP